MCVAASATAEMQSDVLQRNGITTARLKGFQQDLGLSGTLISKQLHQLELIFELARSPVLGSLVGALRILLSSSSSFKYGICVLLFLPAV
jgi:hypothetical protein